jgi:hypothetical protein
MVSSCSALLLLESPAEEPLLVPLSFVVIDTSSLLVPLGRLIEFEDWGPLERVLVSRVLDISGGAVFELAREGDTV